MIPLLLIAVAGAALLLGADRVRDLGGMLVQYAPAELGFAGNVEALIRTGSEAGALTLLAAVVPATTYGEGLVRVFARLSPEEGPWDRPRKGLRGRVLAVALLAVLPLLVVLGLAAVAVLPSMRGSGGRAGVLGAYLSFLVAWAAGAVLLEVSYRTFSPRRLRPSAIAWSAAATGSFLAGMSLGWVLVLRFGLEVGRAYGGSDAIGSGVLFVVYLFLVQLTCLAGYVLAVALSDIGRHAAA